MRKPALSLVVPAFNESRAIGATLHDLSTFFEATGFDYEILVVDDGSTDGTAEVVKGCAELDSSIRTLRLSQNQGKGAALKRGVLDASGEVIAFIDADLPYQLQNLGDAIALVQSGAATIAIGARDLKASQPDPSYPLLRKLMGRSFSLFVRALLVRSIPDTQCGLKVFTAEAAKLLFGESKLAGFGFDFEILYLANKYGFRIERIPVAMTHRHESKVRLVRDSLSMLLDVIRVRLFNRQMAYRSPRRCPVCFSAEVWSRSQIRGHVIRECKRCKCRYLGSFPSEEELEQLYQRDYFESDRDTERGYASREATPATSRTNEKRLALLRQILPPGARILEVGAGNGLFGSIASRDFDYVGIDLSDEAARAARARGVPVYRASLRKFVNTGSAFDAVTLFHVFEHLPDPHDVLARLKDLVKPGGFLAIITPDTESFLCLISGDRWVSYKFPEHLILYSRSALIELLEHSGFEIVSVGGDYEHVEHPFLLARLEQLSKPLASIVKLALPLLPDPIAVSSGSIRIVARRRAGPPLGVRSIRVVEPTHAR